jgi:hypothetical protein
MLPDYDGEEEKSRSLLFITSTAGDAHVEKSVNRTGRKILTNAGIS